MQAIGYSHKKAYDEVSHCLQLRYSTLLCNLHVIGFEDQGFHQGQEYNPYGYRCGEVSSFH